MVSLRKSGAAVRSLVRRWITEEEGQAATEYFMVIAVMVVAMIFATRPFVDPAGPFLSTVENLSKKIGTIIADENSPLLPGM